MPQPWRRPPCQPCQQRKAVAYQQVKARSWTCTPEGAGAAAAGALGALAVAAALEEDSPAASPAVRPSAVARSRRLSSRALETRQVPAITEPSACFPLAAGTTGISVQAMLGR